MRRSSSQVVGGSSLAGAVSAIDSIALGRFVAQYRAASGYGALSIRRVVSGAWAQHADDTGAHVLAGWRRRVSSLSNMKHFNSSSMSTLIGIASLLAGCVTLYDEVPDTLPLSYVPPAAGQTGVAVGSVTSPPNEYGQWQEASRYSLRSRTDPAVVGFLRSGSDDFYGRLGMPFAYLRYPDYRGCAEEEGLETECGRLFAMELPAGEYEIREVIVSGRGNGSSWIVELPDYRFTVQAGAVSYLGNLNNRLCIGSLGFSNLVIAVSGEVRDNFDRDWPLLRAKYPFLANQPIERAAIQGSPWLSRLWKRKVPKHGWDACDDEESEGLGQLPDHLLDTSIKKKALTG